MVYFSHAGSVTYQARSDSSRSGSVTLQARLGQATPGMCRYNIMWKDQYQPIPLTLRVFILWKKLFWGNFGNTDLVGGKTRKWQWIWNCNKYCVNQIFNPNTIFFFLLTGYNKITVLYTYYLHILHNLQAMKMTFLKFFLICTFKDPKLAEKWTNLAKKK